MQVEFAKRRKNLYDNRVTQYIKGGRKMLSARIDPALYEQLDALVSRSKLNRSELVEEAVRLLLERESKLPSKPRRK